MGPLARFIGVTSVGVRTWLHFAIGGLLLIVITGAIDFWNSGAHGAPRAPLLSSLIFAVELVAASGLAGALLWLVIRAIKGKGVDEFRDSVLWSAYLLCGLFMVVRLIR